MKEFLPFSIWRPDSSLEPSAFAYILPYILLIMKESQYIYIYIYIYCISLYLKLNDYFIIIDNIIIQSLLQVYNNSCIKHLHSYLAYPLKFIYKYTIEIFFSPSLFRLRNVCLISLSINRLFESTYQMYESLMSIGNMFPKYYAKTPACLEINIFHFHLKSWCYCPAIYLQGITSVFPYGNIIAILPWFLLEVVRWYSVLLW